MAEGAIDLEKPEHEMSRSELTLGQIARQWQFQPRGEAFTQALLSFLRSFSGDTLQSYAFSVLQFYGWIWQRDGRAPTPDRVSRGDAVEFNRWLRTHDVGLIKWWLEKDPERRFDLRIYDIVAHEPGIGLDDIGRQLGVYTSKDRLRLIDRLGCLTKRRTLERRPTVAEYRRAQGGAIVTPPDSEFRYTVARVHTAKGVDRASTVSTRMAALASLWAYMIRSGENLPGATEPLLRHNIWLDPLKQARSQAQSHQEINRQLKKPDLQFFLQLLATTFSRTHGAVAFQAAEAAFFGRSIPKGRAVLPSFKDVRDRALLLMMAQTGVRVREVGALKRGDVMGDPPRVVITGKRGKKRTVTMPIGALSALSELSAKLKAMADQQERYGGSTRASELLSARAPLFPAVAYWGANAGQSDAAGLTRPGIALMLNRRAEAAGFKPGSEAYKRAHPHGLRALFITYALETGTPIHRVQAIVGHASVAMTGRYAEERKAEALVADVFRAAPPVAEVPRPLPPQAILAETWRPSEEPIAPPAAPRPKPYERRAPPEEPSAPMAPTRIVRREVERAAVIAPEAAPAVAELPRIAPPAPSEARESLGRIANDVARYRRRPLTEKEEQTLERCVGIDDETLRHLCVIYDIHWGEEGNRQVLVSSGGGKASALSRAQRAEPNQGEEFEDDFPEEEETEEEEWDPLAALEEVEERGLARIAEVARAGAAELVAEAGTDRLNRIYSGKESGLNWWTGTQGKLKPEMPVMSPDQVGTCTPDTEDTICAGLVKLWQRWFEKSPTKAESLVRWLGEALDTSAQLEAEIRRRGGAWVPSATGWGDTRFTGSRKQPDPRMVFREHVPEEVVAWFKARAGDYRVSPGDPTSWQKKTSKPKVIGEAAPDWFTETDPVRALPLEERRALLDWILALSGQLPLDMDARFVSPSGFRASRADIAQVLWALCQFDQAIDAMRESAEFGPQFVASLFKHESVDDLPSSVRFTFQEAERRARFAMSAATGGRVGDFDAWATIRGRIKTRKTGARRGRTSWAVDFVREQFGEEAAADLALKLVTQCGNVPLSSFRDLFRVSGETIVHTAEFKRAFAEQFGTHSECVARRIARQLWEIRQGRAAPKEAVDKPQHMVTLVEVMRTFKVSCGDAQEQELRQLIPWLDRPEGIYQEYAKARTGAGSERDELSEAELQERELAEEYEEAIAGALRAEQFGSYETNPHELALPTPVHLMLALW